MNETDSSLIWTGNIQDFHFPVFSSQNTSIAWLCERNSPCGHIVPKLSNPSPYLYLLLEASTEQVNRNFSYCKLKERFIIRLYGLPAKFDYAVIMTFSSFGMCFIGVLIYIFTKWRLKSRHEQLLNISLKRKSEAILPKSKSVKSSLYSSASNSLGEARAIIEKSMEVSSSDDEDFIDNKERQIKDSILADMVENNRLRQRGRSVLE